MKQLIKDNVWGERLSAADKAYKQWEGRFKCDMLERYYEGEQWRSQNQLGYVPYVINKFYELIQLKISKYIPSFPNFVLSSKPASSEWDPESAAKAAQLKEDLLNTLIDDQRKHFTQEIEQSYKDSFNRFGLIEVGYAADWIWNPNAPKDLLKKDVDKTTTGREGRKVVEEPPELPLNERIYFKHVPAKHFRVGGLNHKYLENCGWCGYYEYIDKDELLSLKIMNKDKVDTATGHVPDMASDESAAEDHSKPRNSLKIWKIWDLKAKVQLVILDSPKATLFQRTFKRLPLIDFRPDRRVITGGFYPIPPCYHWLSSQNEINETREQLRAHRRRFIRKYQVQKGKVDNDELEKFETGPDGSLIQVMGENAITAIDAPNLGPEGQETQALATDDLNKIAGSTEEEQGTAQNTTATQAKLVDARSSVRGSKDQDRIVEWFGRMGREALLMAREKFVLGTWVKMTGSEGSFAGTYQQNTAAYKWVSAEDLNDGYDFKIDVDLTSISASIQDLEKKKMLEFLSILTQFPMVSFSPVLIREIAYRVGYRNERVLAEYQKMALLMELARMNQLQGAVQPQQPQQGQPGATGGVPNNGNAPQQQVAAMTPPGTEEIRQQMTQQLRPGIQ